MLSLSLIPTSILFSRNIFPRDKTPYLSHVDVGRKLHVASLDRKYLHTTFLIGNSDVQLPVESPESPESRIDDVRSVGRRYNDHVRCSLDSIHERQQLGHDTFLGFSAGLFHGLRFRLEMVKAEGWSLTFGLTVAAITAACGARYGVHCLLLRKAR